MANVNDKNNVDGTQNVVRPPVDPNAPAPMVQQMVAGQQPFNVFQGGNGIMGRFENPNQRQNPMSDGGSTAKPTTFENMPVTTGWTAMGQPVYEGTMATPSYRTDEVPQGNLMGSIIGKSLDPNPRVAPFEKDDTKRDGGFFGWLGGLVKKRPGQREGETDDEYDERMTRNNERIAVLADAIRHMGNIYNTSKGAPVQRFNSPTAGFEQGLKERKAERKAKAAAEADAAYKEAQMQMKRDAAEADKAYKTALLGYKDSAEKRAQKKADDDNEHWNKNYERLTANDKVQQGLAKDKFEETKRHNQVSERQGAARIAISQARLARSGGGSGSGGLSGKGGSLTNLSTPRGHMNRKKDLNSIEKKQLKDYLYKNGFITKAAARQYDNALSEAERGAVLNHWIGWAANSKLPNAEKFRQNLRDHFGYVETVTTPNNGNGTAGAAKTPTTPKGSKRSAKPKGKRGNIVV